MVQVVTYLIFAHSKEVLNFYEKLGAKVTEWSEIFGMFKGLTAIRGCFQVNKEEQNRGKKHRKWLTK